MKLVSSLLASCLLWGAIAAPVIAADQKRDLAIPAFAFEGGHKLPLRLGYETWGTLDARRDNAILVCHYFSGTSHAAGPKGYWESSIGEGKAIDTRRYFVVSADVPCNLNVGNPTTGPSSLDPETLTPYGSRYPAVTVHDMVQSQLALMKALNIPRWHAVVGASLGGMQALRWSVDHPELVERVAAFGAPGRSDGHNQALCQMMIQAIKNDPHWQLGNYGSEPPQAGLEAAWSLLYIEAIARRDTPGWQAVAKLARQRCAGLDARAYVQLARASRDFDLARGHGTYTDALKRMPEKILIVAAEGDQLFPPRALQADLIDPLEAVGKHPTFRTLATQKGHLGVVFDLDGIARDLKAFIDG